MDAPLLVVESTVAMKLTAERGLPNACRVIGASSIGEALEVLRNERVAAVLIEAQLRDGSGFDVVRAVREQHGLVPVLIATSVVCRDEVNEAQRLRSGILARPFPDSWIVDFVRASLLVLPNSRDTDRIHAVVSGLAERYGIDDSDVFDSWPSGAGRKTPQFS